MELKNDLDGMNALNDLIYSYYKKNGDRKVHIFLRSVDDEKKIESIHFLLESKYVAKYSVGESDRGSGFLGALGLAIGPHYFSPSQFWSYENAQRFRMSTEPFDIEFNLQLFDEFLKYAA